MSKIIETRTIIEAIYYLLKQLGTVDKVKLLKLIYLADKYHLIFYGRTITNDDYYAMEMGPVASTVKDVLQFDDFALSDDEFKYTSSLIKKKDAHSFEVNKAKAVDLEMLAESDIEALDYIVNEFGAKSSWDLSSYTHKYPEWHQYKELFENGETKRERIETEELFSIIDKHFSVSEEHIEESKRIAAGDFD